MSVGNPPAKRQLPLGSLHAVEDQGDMFDNGDPYDIIYLDFRKALGQFSHSRFAVKL